jgi:peptidyl-prolyl cis-trans isomerase SurA
MGLLDMRPLLLILLACAAVTCSDARAQLYTDRVAAVVNGDVILVSDLDKYKKPIVRSLTNLNLGIVPPGKWPTEKEILDELVVMHILAQEADRQKVTVDDSAVEGTVQSIMKRNNLTQDQFVVHLAASGLAYPDYRDLMKRQLRLRKLIASEVAQKVPLSEEDAQEYFKKNQGQIEDQFKQFVAANKPAQPKVEDAKLEIPTHETVYEGGTVRLRQIVLKAPQGANAKARSQMMEKAARIYQEAVSGGDFAKLAKQYSEDPAAAAGGDLGLIPYKDLQAGVQQIVRRMKVGDVTRPLGTQAGVFLFYLADAKGRNEKQVPIPKEVRQKLEKQLAEMRDKQTGGRGKKPGAEGEDEAPQGEKEEAALEEAVKAQGGKDPGILTPEQMKEYAKVRSKVITILRENKLQARLKDWIEELKKKSIIEVKL